MRDLLRFPPNVLPSREPYAEFDDDNEDFNYGVEVQPLIHAAEEQDGNLSWKSALKYVLGSTSYIESARVNHQFTTEERKKLNNVESIDYLAPNSSAFRRWLARQPHKRRWDKWLMMAMIGVCIGLTAYTLETFIQILSKFKWWVTIKVIEKSNLGLGWFFNCFFSLLLALGSTYLVVMRAPVASGSGIPEVMAYLNGCLLPKVFNVRTVMVKYLSCLLAVASGLPVGPEGPLIHIGAALGAAISQGHSTTMGWSSSIFKRFRNPRHKRDFVTAGVAVGVATAFNAPIGGLLFAYEEVASFWEHSLLWQSFFSCMCGVLTLNLAKSAFSLRPGTFSLEKATSHFGLFDNVVAFETAQEFSSHVLAVIPAAILGLACGVLAIVFTVLNLKISRLRDAIMKKCRWKRMLEPCLLCLIYVTGSMILPLWFRCEPKCSNSPANSSIPTRANCTAMEMQQLLGEEPLPLYCPQGSSKDDYNQLATLLFNTGESTIKHLFSRGSHHRFKAAALLTLLVWYFFGAALTAGSAISSGLFVPMIMIGALIGRLVGYASVLALHNVVDRISDYGMFREMGGQTKEQVWRWVDPGAFALVGAGAFMGGVTRLTVSVAVIMIEISDDVHMLLPVLAAIMIAKWVADAATHPLYHGLLEVKSVPFLPLEPTSRYSLDLIPVSYIMHSPVVTLPSRIILRDLQNTLRETYHNGFPVVQNTQAGSVCVGLISRSHLMVLLKNALFAGTTCDLEVTWNELNKKMMDPVTSRPRYVEEQQELAALVTDSRLSQSGLHVYPSAGSNTVMDEILDLSPYVNTSAIHVLQTFSVERTYVLFRTMGLRHLVVVDEHNRVKGIVTRKDLLGFKLDEAMTRCLSSAMLTRRGTMNLSDHVT